MSDCVEVFVLNGGKVAEVDAAVLGVAAVAAAIDGDAMAALNQADRDFFGEGFKAAIVSRDASGA